MKKTRLCLFIALVVFMIIPAYNVSAKTLRDLYNELDQLKEKKASNDNKKKLTQNELNSILNTIKKTNNEIETARRGIKQAEDSIVEAEKTIKEKEEESKELLKFLQLSSGENVYLDYILASDDYTDFIYRYSVVSQLSDYNANLMNELEESIKQLENSKKELAVKASELSVKRQQLSSQRNSLGSQVSSFEQVNTTIEEDIADLNKEINYYKNTLKCTMDQNLNSCTAIPYANGFKYPLKSAYVSSVYGWRTYTLGGRRVTDFHRGVDLAGNGEGTYIYAAAAGKVARIVTRSSCGGNMVYVYHNVNGRGYTTVYMHMLEIKVSYGQVVTDSTVIGLVGGGSKTWWDGCSTGAHLHFGMAEGNNAYTFNTYAFDPLEIFKKLYKGARFSSR